VDMMKKGLWCLVVRSQSYSWSAVELNDGVGPTFRTGKVDGEEKGGGLTM
jgi:hypothetical protein